MATVLLVFSGVSFSHALLDKGIERAKASSAGLTVLFLQEEPVEEDYGFPSDIDSAENLRDEADAREDDMTLLRGKMRLVKRRAGADNVACTIRVSNDFSEEAILSVAGDAILILIDAGTAENAADNDLPFSPATLTKLATCPVELIKNR